MNSQLSLVADERLSLVPDAEGGIWYQAGLVPHERQRQWFEALLAGTAWRSERRPMYEREVDVPRLMASHALDAPDLPAPLAEALAALRPVLAAPFTHVGLNLYRDGRDSVAPHNDRLPGLAPGQPIAILSLGDEREMLIRAKAPPHRPLRVPLAPGSLLVMSHASQKTHEHGIPKSPRAVGPRISLAFRVRAGAANQPRMTPGQASLLLQTK